MSHYTLTIFAAAIDTIGGCFAILGPRWGRRGCGGVTGLGRGTVKGREALHNLQSTLALLLYAGDLVECGVDTEVQTGLEGIALVVVSVEELLVIHLYIPCLEKQCHDL